MIPDTGLCTQLTDGEDFLRCHPPLQSLSRSSDLGQLNTYPSGGTHGSWGTRRARRAWRTRNTDGYERDKAGNSWPHG